MNYISWMNKGIINEGAELSAALKPIVNKMKNVSRELDFKMTGFRDSRLFLFQFLKDRYPNLIPSDFETRKPTAVQVNAIIGDIALKDTDFLAKLADELDEYSKEDVGGLDRVSSYINTQATMRHGKGVRQSKAEAAKTGGSKKDYSKITAKDIASVSGAPEEKVIDSGESNEKFAIRLHAVKALSDYIDDVNQKYHTAVADKDTDLTSYYEKQINDAEEVTDAINKIDSLEQYERFVDYLSKDETWEVMHTILSDEDLIDVIETSIGDWEDRQKQPRKKRTSGEDEEHEQEESLVGKEALLDLTQYVEVIDHDGPDFVFVRDQDGGETSVAIDRLDFIEDEEHEQEESLVGKEALLDLTQPVTVVSHDEPGFVYVMDQDGGEMNVSIDRLDFTNKEDEEFDDEDFDDETPLEELSSLTPGQYKHFRNFDNFNPDEWSFDKHENIYSRKEEGGEVYESYSTAHYMGIYKQPRQVLQESNRLSPQEVNRQLILNEKKRVQHLYTQQRRYMDGY